jgi:hypothetical protein
MGAPISDSTAAEIARMPMYYLKVTRASTNWKVCLTLNSCLG